MIIVMEGASRSGKSSLAAEISKNTGLLVFAISSQNRNVSTLYNVDASSYYYGMCNALIDMCRVFDNFIIDRFIVSEYVYSRVYGRKCLIPLPSDIFKTLKSFNKKILHLHCKCTTTQFRARSKKGLTVQELEIFSKSSEVFNQEISWYSREFTTEDMKWIDFSEISTIEQRLAIVNQFATDWK